ncbi:MAG: response regulator [Pseudomonadota bacterium]
MVIPLALGMEKTMASELALINDYVDNHARGGAGRGVQCLLVDDNRFDRYNVRYAAERAGLTLAFTDAATAAAARELIRNESFGLIILDQNLPDGAGLDLALEASISVLNANAPMIMLTGLDDSALALGAQEAGCVEFLTKNSLNGTSFAAALRRALDKSMGSVDASEFPAASDAFEMMLEGFGELYLAQTIKPVLGRMLYLTAQLHEHEGPMGRSQSRAALAELDMLAKRLWVQLDNQEDTRIN